MNQRFSTNGRGPPAKTPDDSDAEQSGYAEQRGKQFDPNGWGEANADAPREGSRDREAAGSREHAGPRYSGDSHTTGRGSGRDGKADAGRASHTPNDQRAHGGTGALPNQGQAQGRDSFGERPQRASGQDVGVVAGNSSSESGHQRSDVQLQEAIHQRLANDDQLDAGALSVQCRDRVVRLEGTVSEQRLKNRAEDVAKQCDGVSDIDIDNRITISRGT